MVDRLTSAEYGSKLSEGDNRYNRSEWLMGGKTITRADLAEAVYRCLGLSRTESAAMVEMVLEEICEAVVRGESVKLSSFGSFVIRQKGQRIGRNPKTGQEVPIPPRRVTVFKPSNIMKKRINDELTGAGSPSSTSET